MDADHGRMPSYKWMSDVRQDPWDARSPYHDLPSDCEPESQLPKHGDNVHLPNHYARWKIEPIHFIEENGLPFWMGNVIKYVMRHDAKNGLEDLKKARRYLDMQIAKMEGNPKWWK